MAKAIEITGTDGKTYLPTALVVERYRTNRETLDRKAKAGHLTRYRVDDKTNYYELEELEKEFKSPVRVMNVVPFPKAS